jgi:multidrug efflux pump subunit AcrA (membrane-fusion protein)
MDVPRPIKARPRTRRIVVVVAGLAAIVAVTLGLRWLTGRAPEIDQDALWIGTVSRSELRLEVRGQGRLVPEEIRWASAPMAARVERVLVQPGAEVVADAILIELSNPDAELAVLDAEREVASAEAELARLGATLDTARLAQESAIAALGSDHAIADRRAAVDAEMAEQGVLSTLESAESADRATQLEGRVAFEKKRLSAMRRSDSAQLEAQRGEVERLRELARFRRRQLDALKVRAGAAGVVQQVAVEVGQTVTVGAPLAKVVRPDRLKAELRIPETAAEDLAIGLPATIDTRSGVVTGEVIRVDPAAKNGSVTVDVSLTGALPKAARPDLTVDGTIELARTGAVLHVARPAVGEAHATASIFKLTADGEAVRVPVTFGRASVEEIEITAGLVEGDRVILSDMSRWDGHDRLRLK